MNKSILVDTGFWIALYNERDKYHKDAIALVDLMEGNSILIPWPTLYETINTRFCRNKNTLLGFESFIKNSDTILIDDLAYRNKGLNDTFENVRMFSLVDRIIRSIIADTSYKIDYLLTFNSGDFIDLCSYRRIEILDGSR